MKRSTTWRTPWGVHWLTLLGDPEVAPTWQPARTRRNEPLATISATRSSVNTDLGRQVCPSTLGRNLPLQGDIRDVAYPESDQIRAIGAAIDLPAANKDASHDIRFRHPKDLRGRPAVVVLGLAVPESASLHLAHQRIDRPGPNSRSITELGRKVVCNLLRTDRE